MPYALLIMLAAAMLLAALAMAWRIAARHMHLPCPSLAAWSLELGWVNRTIGAPILVKRLKLAPGMHVADIGCGPGRIAIPLARAVGPAGRVTALDLQRAMLDKMLRRAGDAAVVNITPVHGAAGQGLLPEAAFDRAILVTVLGEIPNQSEALAEIARALVPGGLLSVSELIPDPHYQSKTRVRRLCEAAGLRHVETFGPWYAFTSNFQKPAASG